MRVHADQEKCCGAGSCVLSAPDVFDQRDADGIVVVLDTEPPAELHEAVREAAAICPAAAISLS
ncbi:ferredoxin [Streptomyces halobius]|uniref:Ferredoxin n=1 Tax=Streptomyces halobius TaxID=2879846 RepID=A0ABY4MCS0_9ACTN|nr:ferredoxin [Streptomyces halobius]UQA94156.1 ferredoxin [Streptomyces halobius]